MLRQVLTLNAEFARLIGLTRGHSLFAIYYAALPAGYRLHFDEHRLFLADARS